ncbi:hypothetical protein [Fervidibacillus halotolerans]|uniref:Uncharacterized protein n=1 Tax=Fervidibacillus halotolerans TaxID=2980027 RepID=A0A9E8LZG5_9BACI|nr:hypothetical protein [Fervidibacillus halotolerans]WAA12653.1 hypothetical protein OE105_00465 [Fervidibacillus halotolerans]
MKKQIANVIFTFIVGLMIGFILYEPTMSHWNKFLYNRHKNVSEQVKIISSENFDSLVEEQRELAYLLEKSIRYPLIGEFVRNGADELNSKLFYLSDHPEIEKVKIRVQVIDYRLTNQENIKFFADGGEILEVYIDGKWEPFNDEQLNNE